MTGGIFSLSGKTALVTGGAHGLGRMIAEGLLAAGASVIITSRKQAEAERAGDELRHLGRIAAFAANLATPEGCTALAEQVRRQVDALHILINNAGRTWGAPFETFPDKAWDSVMAVNLQAPFTLFRDLLPALKAGASADDPARVINVGSIAGKVVEPIEAFSYAASKAAIHHLSRMLAAELAGDHICVNTLVPGYFPTHMTDHMRTDPETESGLLARVPLKRFGSATDIAGACIFLASRAGSYVTGTELVLDGGMAGCR